MNNFDLTGIISWQRMKGIHKFKLMNELLIRVSIIFAMN